MLSFVKIRTGPRHCSESKSTGVGEGVLPGDCGELRAKDRSWMCVLTHTFVFAYTYM